MSSNLQTSFRFLFVISIIVLTTFLFIIFFKTAYPFVVGLAIALIINPFVNFLQEKLKITRWLAVTLTLLLLIAFIITAITIFITEIIMGTNYLSQSVPLHLQTFIYDLQQIFTQKIIPIYEQISTLFYSLNSEHQATILAYIETITLQITSSTSNIIQSLLNGISEFLLGLPNLATAIIFSLLAAFFISKDWYKLVSIFRKSVPQVIAERTKDIMLSLKKAFAGFIFAQLTLISITSCIVLIGLLILRVDYPITIALIIAAVDLLPYLGTGLIFIPWIFYTFFTGQLPLTIGLSILYGIVVVQRQVMEPKILSSNIGVDPLATLLSLFVGYKLFGFLGLIIGPVILVFIQTLHNAHVFRDIKNYILNKG